MSRIVDPVLADLQSEHGHRGVSRARRRWLAWTWYLRLAAALYRFSVLLALSFAAIPISLFALAIARRVRRAISGIFVGVVPPAGYMLVMFVVDARPAEYTFHVALTPWAPNALFLLGAAGLLYRRRERTRDA